MAMNLEEQEQVAALKAWWNQYGNWVAGLILVISLGVLAWQGWGWYQATQSEKAMVAFQELEKSLETNNLDGIRGASDVLANEYGGTAFATIGNMIAANLLFQNKEYQDSASRFEWVVKNGFEPEWKMMARLYLAQVLTELNETDRAIEVLDVKPVTGYETALLVTRGDVYYAADKMEEAKNAYQAAIETLKTTTSISVMTGDQTALFKDLLGRKLAVIGE